MAAAAMAVVLVAAVTACGGSGGPEGFGSAGCTDPLEDVALQEGVSRSDGQPAQPGTLVPDALVDLRRATIVTEAPGTFVATFQFAAPIEEALAATVEAGGEVRSWLVWLRFSRDLSLGVDLAGGGAGADPLSLSPYLSGTLTARRPVSEDQDLYTEVPATVRDGQAVPVPPGSPLFRADGRGPLELAAEVEGDTLTVTGAELHRYVLDFPPREVEAMGATSFDDHKIDSCTGPFPFSAPAEPGD